MLVENQSLCASAPSPCGDLERGVGQILNATQVTVSHRSEYTPPIFVNILL